ncbi:MAG: alpha/beta hydrolase [Spirochaetales bacterium]|nr:alpha/beta hydrolase [Spirochaetales bacterium]
MKKKKWIIIIIIAALLLVPIIGFIFSGMPVELILHSIRYKADYNKDELGTVYKDLVYKTIDTKTMKLDIYMPRGMNKLKTPVTVFIHGGAWLLGSKEDILSLKDTYNMMEMLRNQGYAVVSIDYRLLDEQNNFPDNIEDCKDAIRWIRKNANNYDLDPENIGVWGSSAGGHLSLMVGLTDDNTFRGDAELSQYSSRVNYVVDHYGPTDLSEHLGLNHKKHMTKIKEKIRDVAFDVKPTEYENFKAKCIENSPTTSIKKDSVPILVIHGMKDALVNIAESEMLIEAVNQAGGSIESYFVENANHMFAGASDKTLESIVKQSVDFILKNTLPLKEKQDE